MSKVKNDPDRELNGFTLKTHYIPGDKARDTKRVQVLLPRSYEEDKENYPVVYMFDGQNLFYDEESYSGISWRVSEALAHYPDLPTMIVVAINNSIDRINEYSPWRIESSFNLDEDLIGKGGGGVSHAQYIVENVKPFIDKNYRTKSDFEHTGLIGSSLGGVMTAYMGIKYADVFGSLGVFSLANQLFKNAFSAFLSNKKISQNQKVYIQVGTEEVISEDNNGTAAKQDYLDCSIYYQKQLIAHGADVKSIDFNVYIGETHNEKYWGDHLPECLRFMSADW